MANLQQRNGSYRIRFRHDGKLQTFTLGEVDQDEAENKAKQVDYLLMRLKQGLVTIPAGVDVVDFIRFDGKPPASQPVATRTTLGTLRDRYIKTNEASLETNSLGTIKIHFGHFEKILGETFDIASLTLADLQEYVDQRAKAPGSKGRKVSPVTIRKELVTLRTAWNWGAKNILVAGVFPNDGLRFPKGVDKPSFMTRAQIERKITKGMPKAEVADLWDALYLQVEEIDELLKFVKARTSQPFVYPMFCFAAHTGARRSEIIRLRVTDVDFEDNSVTVTEKKRVKGKTTTRRVPLSPFLRAVLKDWLKVHPGGTWLFCQTEKVARSKSHKGEENRSLTVDEAHDHFQRTLEKSKWDVINGWHCLRHSFISACASKGIDQRLVEEFAGHMSPEISRRYRHLYPSTKNEAIASVFE